MSLQTAVLNVAKGNFQSKPSKISLKKFVFSKVANLVPGKFYLRKKLAKTRFSQISLLGKNLRERN